MNGEGGHAAHAENRAEKVRAAAEVLLSAEELAGLALLLHRVVGRRGALDLDGRGLELEGLRAVGGELEHTGEGERGAHGLGDNAVVDLVAEALAVDDDLQVLEAAAVVQGHEAEVLHVADGADPAGDGHGPPAERIGVRVEACDGVAIHKTPLG